MPASPVTEQQPAGTILVLDDEPDVRKLVSTVLTRNGYAVLTADSGENAIKVFQRHQQPLDLLLLDVVSPGLSGPMVAERLAALQPGLRVMFMSGFGGTSVVRRFVVDKGFALLSKPFTPDQLTAKVREVLASPAAVPAHVGE
jgi:CheY-like chemotaxis protein